MSSSMAITGRTGTSSAFGTTGASFAFNASLKWGARVNTLSAGPFASRAASAIGIIQHMVRYCEKNSALPQALDASEVGATVPDFG